MAVTVYLEQALSDIMPWPRVVHAIRNADNSDGVRVKRVVNGKYVTGFYIQLPIKPTREGVLLGHFEKLPIKVHEESGRFVLTMGKKGVVYNCKIKARYDNEYEWSAAKC